jgi:hypothetical protein
MNTKNAQNYQLAVLLFVENTKTWGALDQYKFYTCKMSTGDEPEIIGGWIETPDNAHGGLDVAWAFGKSPRLSEIAEQYISELEIKAGLYTG